ncbi:MAG: ATP-binding cassette domain-containing protein [Desulfonatronovibrio sp.]
MPNSSSSDSFLLKLERITHFFDQRLVFKNVDFVAESGTVTVVAGPNGAGKTTLIKIMSGLISPSRGRIERNVSKDRTAFLGHDTFVYSGLSALDNLKFWARVYSVPADDEHCLQVLDTAGLKTFALEKAGHFSRGMAQRLSLARVLLLKPDFLLLDEPGTGLDQDSRKFLRREIKRSAGNGAAVVWVSHTLEEDLGLTDRVLFLRDKKQVFYGSTRDYRSWSMDNAVEH